jgi:hypothetical protein
MYAGAGRVKREFSDRNAHAVRAEIAEAKDAFAVGDDNELGLMASCSEVPRYVRDRWR